VSADKRDGDRADDRPDGRADEPVGSAAEEAAKLFGALGDALTDRGSGDRGAGFAGFSGFSGLAGHAARTLRDLDEHLATGSPECTYCPLCRTVHLARQTSPEVRAHLLTAAGALVQAVSGLLATVVPEQAAHRPGGVEHIDLDGDLDGDLGGDLDGDLDPEPAADTDPEEDGR
jgi:hypothetical protein